MGQSSRPQESVTSNECFLVYFVDASTPYQAISRFSYLK